MGLFSTAAHELGLFNPAYSMLGQVANLIFPVATPGPAEIFRAVKSGWMQPDKAGMALRAQGIEFGGAQISRALQGLDNPLDGLGYGGLWRSIFNSQVQVASPGELLAMLNQEILTRQQLDRRMKLLGFWWTPYVDEMVLAAQNRIPDPSDLVRFAVRDVWDNRVVERFQYDAEFPLKFKTFMRRMGFDGDSSGAAPGAGPPGGETWSQIFWRAHWANISPGQAYEMFQRLRPNRVTELQAIFPDLRPFTLDDLNTVLRVNDYPIPFRSQLAAIAYHKPRLVDIDRFYTDGAINEEEAYEYHLDLGYSPRDARLRTNWLATKKTKGQTGIDSKKLVQQIVEMYKHGLLDRQGAFRELARLIAGRSLEPVLTENVGDAALGLWAKWHTQINQILDQADMAQQLSNAKLLLKTWRSRYFKGMINAAELREDMRRTRFQDAYINQFIARLDTELAGGRLMLSTEKIRKLVVDGILPIETARKYLVNLGWKNPELSYLIAQVQRDVELEQLRQAERDARDRRTQEEAQVRMARIAQAKRRQVVQRLNRQATPAALRRYFVHAVITEAEYVRELERRGFTDATIKTIITDANLARQEYLAKRGRRRQRDDAGQPAGNQPAQTAPGAPPQQPVNP